MPLPVLGVALSVAELSDHIALVRDAERDVELQDFIAIPVLTGDWRSRAERALALLGDHTGRVGLHGPFYGFELSASDPDVARVVRTRLDQALDVAEALGGRAPHIVVHSPVDVWDHHNLGMRSGAFERIAEPFVANMKAALARAEAAGVTFVLENIRDFDPTPRARLVAAAASPALKLSIDTGHANYGHGRFGGPPADYFVREAGADLAHLHLQDTDGYADRHWAIGEGNIAWPALFRVLHEVSALTAGGADAPRLILELFDKAGLAASVAHLERLGLAR